MTRHFIRHENTSASEGAESDAACFMPDCLKKSIMLLSSSSERRKILAELGYDVVLPSVFIDVEKEEKIAVAGDPDIVSRNVLDAKFDAYLKSGAFACPGTYLIADTLICCSSNGENLILGKCRDDEQARFFLDLYSGTDRILIRSSAFIIERLPDSDGNESGLKKRFCSDDACIRFDDEYGANMVTEEFKEKYVSGRHGIGRAGAVDCDAFSASGFRIVGNRQTIRGLCPF